MIIHNVPRFYFYRNSLLINDSRFNSKEFIMEKKFLIKYTFKHQSIVAM